MLGEARSATAMWAAADVRRRWRSLVLLGVLVGITAGAALAALVGSFQNRDALRELRSLTDAPDAIVFASQRIVLEPDWDRLRSLPEVERLGVWHLLFGKIDGSDAVLFAPEGEYLQTMNAPIVIDGRMFDPTAIDEIVVAEGAADEYPIGTQIAFQSITDDDIEGDGAVTGPTQTFTVVGVIRTINQFLFAEQAFVSPGYLEHYADQIATLQNADIDLRDPTNDVPALQSAVNASIGEGVPVFDLSVAARRVQTTLDVESTTLLALAIVIAAVGGLLVAQAVGRSVAAAADDVVSLQALGMTTGEVARAAVRAHLVMSGAAAITLVATAIALSRTFPVGLGRMIHPDVGTQVAWAWLLPAVAVTMLVTTSGVAAIAAMSIARRRRRENSRTAAHVLGLNRMTSVPIWLGTAMAVDPGRGHRRIPVRAALVASTVGVTGVVAALAIDDAIDDTLANPGRAGQVSDIDVYPASVESVDAAFDPAWVERVRDAAGASARVAQFGRLATPIDGIGGVALTVKAGAGGQPPELALTVTEGKAPSGAGEVAVGPRTANDLDVAIGDTVRLDELGTSARVVGIALFPPEVHGGFDEGVWVAPVDFDGLARATDGGEAGVEQWLGVQVDGDLDTAVERIDTALGADGAASQVDPPLELDYLRNVERLPLMLAGFLAVLGALSLGHVLSTTIRRRTHEFAVLRALGLERRPTRLILNAQGTSIAVIGLAIGLPLGLAIGRRAWSWVSGAISIQDEAPVITTVLLLSLPVTLLVVNGLAVLPGRRLARMRLADELRAE